MSSLHSGFRVPPLKKTTITAIAQNARAALNIPLGAFDAEKFLEGLVEYGIVFDVFDKESALVPPEVEACWVPGNKTLFIRDSVYASICRGEPRGRFTVAHEVGHMLLAHQPTMNREAPGHEIPVYANSEWQANTFASEFLMPESEMRANNLRTANAVANHFKVSMAAAEIRVRTIWGGSQQKK